MQVRCTNLNIKEFNQLLKVHLPEFKKLIHEMYKFGLIQGLGGATILLDECMTKGVVEKMPPQAATAVFCKDCCYFVADTVGDGTGVGQCLKKMYKTRLIWPKTEGCHLWKHVI